MAAGIGLAAAPGSWWVLVGAALMLALLLGASIPMMEQRSLERRPDRGDVVRRVPRVIWAVGQVQPNTSWVPDALLDERGFVRVRSDLRVRGHADVFAVGDVAATDPLRTSARNQAHKLVARNVLAQLDGSTLREYRSPGRRWGSVLGVQRDGLVVFAPNGRGFRIPRWSIDPLLQRFVVRRGIYGGVRRGPDD